jgi:hypothetical protein
MLLTLSLMLSVTPLALGNELSKELAPTLFLAQAALGLKFLYGRHRDTFYLLTPASLVFFYITLSMALGSWGFKNGYVALEKDLIEFKAWQHTHISIMITMVCMTVIMAIERRAQARYTPFRRETYPKSGSLNLLVATAVLTPFFFLPLDLESIGGNGDLAILPRTLLAIVAITSCQHLSSRSGRWVIYCAMIFIFATFSIEDKREAIFLIFPILYLEFHRSRYRLGSGMLAKLVVLAVFLLILIITMSVARGYGGFGEFNTLSDAIPFVLPYVLGDEFLPDLLANIEVNYFFFHGLNSIEHILEDPRHLSLGTTLIKPLLVFFPRSLNSWKPDSIIGLYTSIHDPAIRAIGGSWPINVVSEFFWNFHMAAPVAAAALAAVLGKLQLVLLNEANRANVFRYAFFLFCYMQTITLARGSGFDQYLVYVLIAGAVALVCDLTSRILGRAASSFKVGISQNRV